MLPHINNCTIMRGIWHNITNVQKLCLVSGQMTPKVCFQLQAEILYAKQGFKKTTTLKSISLNVDKCFINSCIISMYLLQKVYIIFYSLL